jgi:DNA-binding CsgD family transcriptional regulator
LASISQLREGSNESLGGLARSKGGEPFDGRVKSLIGLMHNCTTGVALFDRDLQCKALNGALCAMLAASAEKHLGRQLHQLFPSAHLQLELALRRVWATGNSLANLELTLPLRAGSEPRRWLVNFHPISDESGQVRFVAATFSEITKECGVELKITRLKDKFHSDIRHQTALLDEEFSEMSTRTFEVVSRSVALLRSSTLLKLYASQRRLEAELIRHALYLRESRGGIPVPSSALPNAAAQPGPLDEQEPGEPGELAASAPSPREREVLHFLADGKSSKEIGALLEISTRTVESYRARIMIKLDLHSTAALVRYAIRNKIVEA